MEELEEMEEMEEVETEVESEIETRGSRHSHDGRTGWGRLVHGAFETFAIVGCFAATGITWAAIEVNFAPDPPGLRDAAAQTIYAGSVKDESSSSGPVAAAALAPKSSSSRFALPPATRALGHVSVWLVDGFNVLHAGLLGGRDRSNWWTDSKRRELLDRVESFEDTDAELWIVFDGHRDAAESPEALGPRCVFAPSADAWLVDRVREAPDPTRLAVVTADRQVAGRARSRGARVVSPRDFLARCPV